MSKPSEDSFRVTITLEVKSSFETPATVEEWITRELGLRSFEAWKSIRMTDIKITPIKSN